MTTPSTSQDIDGKAVKAPTSFAELSSLDGENVAEPVDFEDAIRTVTRYLSENMLGVEKDDLGKKILAAPVKHRVVGEERVIEYTNRVFPDNPDLRYVKFMLPAVSILFLGTSKDEYWAGKVKYKNYDEKTKVFKFRRLSATYVRQMQLTGWWRSPIERVRMTQQLVKLFQIAENTGRLTTPKGSHIFVTYLGDRDQNTQDNLVDSIYQNVSTWELKVRGFTDEEYGRVSGIKVSAAPTPGL